jgi:N-acetylmuramoyl-L-alanine amidase
MRTARGAARGLAGALCLIAVGILPAGAHDSDDHPPDHIYLPAQWNGFRIYLSPAHHWGGPKYGCNGYIEDNNMHQVAHEAGHRTTLGAGSLRDRGYRVRLGHGDPDDNVERSNGWNADRHIAIHSNAHGSAPCGESEGGTVVFHYPGSTVGAALAAELLAHVGPSSPGTLSERVDTASFYELSETIAPAAYLETEFHDWITGVGWLRDYRSWAFRIGAAVDAHLGYP